MDEERAQYSEYVVYVDESGDHGIDSINPYYPLFVLSFCIFRKDVYAHQVSPAFRMLKFSTFGHDMVIFHEHEIRKKLGYFSKIRKEQRETLLKDLTQLIADADFTLIPIVIDKVAVRTSALDAPHIYHLAMGYGLEMIYHYLSGINQQQFVTHVIFEARGRAEDCALEFEFRRICNYQNYLQKRLPFEIVVADKKTNSSGLQFADLVSRPVGLSVLRNEQSNRAYEVVQRKVYSEIASLEKPFILPIKAKNPKVVLEV